MKTISALGSRWLRRTAVPAAALLAAFVAAVLPAAPVRAQADALAYSTTRRTFNVGNLLLQSTIDADRNGVITDTEAARGPENPDPFVFYIADDRTDVKPLDWEFVNPFAPKSVTQTELSRWAARDPRNGYQLGQKVTKDMAAYWEVDLQKTPLEDLLRYDLLFITNHRITGFSPVEREKLRKLIDAGGIVWIEDCGNMRVDPTGPFVTEHLQFAGNSGLGGGGGGGPLVLLGNHPILNNPYKLSFQEIANLGDKNYGNYHMHAAANMAVAPNPETLINIVGNRGANGLPYIAAGTYGSGVIIATSSDSGCDINDYAGGFNGPSGGNSGAYCGPNKQTAHAEDLKFVYNLVAWGSASNTERRNGRRTAAAFQSVGAPLLTRFDFTTPGTPADSIVRGVSSPLVVQGLLIVTGTVNNTPVLRAYDTQPYQDLDGDGNGDDGLPDLNLGAPYDEVWRVNLPGGAGGGATVLPSAPTAATLPDGTNALFVTLPDGTLAGYRAFPNTNGRLNIAGQTLPGFPNATVGGGTYPPGTVSSPSLAPSPVYFEGRVHVVQPDGRIRCVSGYPRAPIAAGANLWLSTDAAVTTPGPVVPLGPPTVGFTRLTTTRLAPNSNNSTLDLMLFQPASQTGASGAGTATKARVLPFFLGARNEVLTTPSGSDGTGVLYDTRAFEGGDRYYVADPTKDGPFVAPRVQVFANEADGSTGRQNYLLGRPTARFVGAFMTSGSTTQGRVRVTGLGGGGLPTPDDGVVVVVDYDVLYVTNAYGKPASLPADGTRSPNNPALATNGTDIAPGSMSTVALSPQDDLIFSALESDTSAGGTPSVVSSIYALNEQPGVGNSKARWRFTLFTPQAGADAGLPLPSGTDFDPYPLTNALGFAPDYPKTDSATALPQPEALTEVKTLGAPIVTSQGVVYVLARATSTANGPVTVLMAFTTNREFVLRLPRPLAPGTGVTISQTNALTGQPVQTVLSQGGQGQNAQFVVDAGRGTITLTNFVSPLGNGLPMSASQSFIVKATLAGATAEQTFVFRPQPAALAAPGAPPITEDITGTPITPLRGDYSPLLWYYVLPGEPRSSPTLAGSYLYFSTFVGGKATLMAVDSDPKGNDATVREGRQIFFVADKIGNANPVVNHARWKHPLVGLPGAPAVNLSGAPVGSEGLLAVNTDQGTFVFDETLTLISDGKRVIEVKPDSSAAWVLDATVKRTTAGGELPFFTLGGGIANTTPPTGRVVEERKAISRPSVVRRLGAADLMIADTGNNRVVRVGRSGEVIWELEKITDPFGIASSGDPLTLNGPTDVQFWPVTQFDNNNRPVGYEAHYLIADASNFRVIEVVDFYDQNGRIREDLPGNTRGEHVLVWTTRTTAREGRQLRFQSAARFLGSRSLPAPGPGLVTGVPTLVAVVGNLRAAGSGASAAVDFTGGSLVSLNYNPYNPFNVDYPLRDGAGGIAGNFNPWPGPPSATATANEPGGNGLISESVDDLVIPGRDALGQIDPAAPGTVKRISRPLYFEQLTIPGTSGLPGVSPVPGRRQLFLLCDADGAYEIEPRLVTSGGVTRTVRFVNWFFTQRDYDLINGVDQGNPADPNDDTVFDNDPNDPIGSRRLKLFDPVTKRIYAPGTVVPGLAAQLPRFVPTSVAKLPNGDYLMTNAYTGASRVFGNRQFNGEVFEVKPNAPSVWKVRGTGRFSDFSAPRIVNVPDLTEPLDPMKMREIRQQMGTGQGNTQLLEQPLFASRLF